MAEKTENELREEKLLSKHGEKIKDQIIDASIPDETTFEYDGETIPVKFFDTHIEDEKLKYAVEDTEVGARLFLFWDDNVFCVENIRRAEKSLSKIATMGQRIATYARTDQQKSMDMLVKSTDFVLRFFDEKSIALVDQLEFDDDTFDQTVLYALFMGALAHYVSGLPLDSSKS